MRRIHNILVGCGVLLAVLASAVCAEIIGPGDYQGYLAKDRWGREILLCNRSGVLFIDDSVASRLAQHRGSPLKLKVSEMHQPINPGAAMIKAVDTVKVLRETVSVGLKTEKAKLSQGQGLKLHLTLRNNRKEKLGIRERMVSIVLMTDSPQEKAPPGFKDPEDRAFWYSQETYRGPSLERLFAFGCRSIPVDPAKFSVKPSEASSGKSPSGMESVLTLEPEGSTEGDFVVGTELVPGKYTAYAWFEDTRGFASSKLVDFEVVAR